MRTVAVRQNRGFWFGMFFDNFCTDSLFLKELHGWAKEIIEQAEFISIQVIHHGNELGIGKALIAKKLTDTRPIFLLNMRIIKAPDKIPC
ncbi:hypothetical protein [Mycoavidus sp. SF9855]|uniref:hypothetical protein n=1 Tax=Mycoavidus sp. SF9855 TaxID=2968475 RepID=UPI00211C1A4F|nr:hypothetical protein [Mycoavidus sp. SF9855]UUM21290.1 hypothetical protein NQD60_07575 [Mycoavidus sp. SF9855]